MATDANLAHDSPMAASSWIRLSVLWLPGVLAGVALLWAGAPHGLGVNPDAVYYLDAATHLGGGNGFVTALDGVRRPLVFYPPGYPAVLAFGQWLTGHLASGAVMISALLLVIGSGLMGVIGFAVTRSTVAALLCATLYAVSPSVNLVHTHAWSEQLFLPVMLAGFLVLLRFHDHPSLRMAAILGAMAAATMLARYAGSAFIAAVGLAIFFTPSQSWKDRLRYAGTYLVCVVVPVGLWMLRNWVETGSGTGRPLALHLPGIGIVENFLWIVVGEWATPQILGLRTRVVGGLLIIAAAATGLVLWRARSLRRTRAFVALTMLGFCTAYCGLLAITILLADASTGFWLDQRLLVPLLPCLLLLAGASLTALPSGPVAKALRIGGGVYAVILSLSYGAGSWNILQRLRTEGVGYASIRWQSLPVIREAERLPVGTDLWSNMPDALYYLAGRPVNYLPMYESTISMKANPQFASELRRFCEEITRGGFVVYFRNSPRTYVLSEDDLQNRVPLVALSADSASALYEGSPAERGRCE